MGKIGMIMRKNSLLTGLYDMHCHIFYDVDDGSKSPEMSLKMLEQQYNEGVRTIIATPHYNPKAWHREIEDIRGRFEDMKQLLASSKYSDVRLFLGSEIFYHKSTTPDDIKNNSLITMAGSRYLLMEFNTFAPYDEIRSAVLEAITAGYIPIVAHIERFDTLIDDIDHVYDLKDYGAYLQTNAETVIGDYGRTAKKFVKKLLKEEMIDFLGTDCHRDTGDRVPNIQAAAAYIMKKCSEGYSRKLLFDNPECVLADEYLDD